MKTIEGFPQLHIQIPQGSCFFSRGSSDLRISVEGQLYHWAQDFYVWLRERYALPVTFSAVFPATGPSIGATPPKMSYEVNTDGIMLMCLMLHDEKGFLKKEAIYTHDILDGFSERGVNRYNLPSKIARIIHILNQITGDSELKKLFVPSDEKKYQNQSLRSEIVSVAIAE